MSILNKAEKTLGRKQYHIKCGVGDVGEYVLLPGDPARSDMVAKYLEGAELVANNREHRTFTGYYKGVKVSVTSTGMGCPSAAIAMEELANIGAKVFVRIGSSAAIQEGIAIGDLLVTTGAMKNEGTSRFYVPDVFPAVPDFELNQLLIQTARELTKEHDYKVHVGISATDDAFYGETQEWIEKLHKLKIQNIEMEASALFTIAHLRDLRAACICGVSGNLVTGEVIYETTNDKLVEAWDKEIKVVLETFYRFEEWRKQGVVE
ncbi:MULTISPECIES: nucleoside phosphorylase [unclassified Paenibacillus]|uniref:nucleoside phosphorylase n=1 Tax=unclassified Paenibacillus TaxID=185978 RepID=UPI002406D5F2|nr:MULTISPECIES: nucleoside phosphorylase [unclassified Paenibacillus]MDF9843796.1 uridine phosphorylase [Paenibacillus sp. PastF-2]MDF9850365.1 uridine phosphorylase [Paenibacillus sp. PastM-2]MDF9856932.1 uridine phosphorylase [Paenibacillus sp. PastF-1]MDH6482211.1 uridine phosphorylase [Paenibacillus sp. PastH-2]MDH6509625.1 uridine phosphorylase [Paenibacillus sp. PastM-3]